ncbi:MAG: terpene cyclase/mutase family protein [Methyloprofundus sp.]|nr:terpene cyclase/mutase family protein [Methyloprofundus sp.]
MSLTKFIGLPLRYRIWNPLHIKLIINDLIQPTQTVHDHHTHLSSAINWLCRAQDKRENMPDSGGVSAGWSFEDGWLPSYPETSGYIVETFVAAADTLNRPELLDRANKILDWELSIQNQDGSFPGHFGEESSKPVIFNTGQIMFGMICGYQQLNRDECLEAAVNAGKWLITQQDEDGCWRRSTHNGIIHTYNTRATWALLQTGLLAKQQTLIDAAIKNIDWALTQQLDSGWFENNAFTTTAEPFTHTIAYAVRGILECGLLLDNKHYIAAAEKAAKALANAQRIDGSIAGTYDKDWQSKAYYVCLTGLAQTSIIWSLLVTTQNSDELQPHIDKALTYLKKKHLINNLGGVNDGGIAGSFPIWGRYSMFEYPNWAAKFFADALMMNITDISIPNTKKR